MRTRKLERFLTHYVFCLAGWTLGDLSMGKPLLTVQAFASTLVITAIILMIDKKKR